MWQQAVGKRGELLALGFLQVNSFVLPPPLLKFLSPLCLSASRHSSNCCRTARFSVPSRERKTGRNTESNQKNKIVSRVQLLKSKCWRKERIPDIFGAVTRIAILGCVCAKGWHHSTWRPSLSCSLTTNWFHVFSGCKVFLKTRAAEKTCNRFCVCVHFHLKLASQHVAAIFRSQSSLAELVYGLSGC